MIFVVKQSGAESHGSQWRERMDETCMALGRIAGKMRTVERGQGLRNLVFFYH